MVGNMVWHMVCRIVFVSFGMGFKPFLLVLVVSHLTGVKSLFAQNLCEEHLVSVESQIIVQSPQIKTRLQIYEILESRLYLVLNDIETLTLAIENPLIQMTPEGAEKLFKLGNVLKDQWEFVAETIAELEDLKSILTDLSINLTSRFKEIQAKLAQARNSYSSQKDYATRLMNRYSTAQSMSYETIIENPKMVFADYGYTLNTIEGDSLLMFFSSEIVNELFLNEKTVQSRVISRSLKDAQKGLFGAGYEGAGIKRRNSDKNLIEIRSVGKDANFRFFGYIHNKNEIHIVAYTVSSNHSSVQLQQRINESIYSARENRGHD